MNDIDGGLDGHLAEGTDINGTLKFKRAVQIDGRFEGNIKSAGKLDSSSKQAIAMSEHSDALGMSRPDPGPSSPSSSPLPFMAGGGQPVTNKTAPKRQHLIHEHFSMSIASTAYHSNTIDFELAR